jgi:hypothetical protein
LEKQVSVTNLKDENLRLAVKVSENRVERRMFGPNHNEIIGGWRKLHDDELPNLYTSPDITRMIKFRMMRLTCHVGSIGQKLAQSFFRKI